MNVANIDQHEPTVMYFLRASLEAEDVVELHFSESDLVSFKGKTKDIPAKKVDLIGSHFFIHKNDKNLIERKVEGSDFVEVGVTSSNPNEKYYDLNITYGDKKGNMTRSNFSLCVADKVKIGFNAVRRTP